MRLVMTIVSDVKQGRKIWLSGGQTVDVGRSEEACIALPWDAQLADVQFMLRGDARGFHLEHRGGECATQINGESSDTALLRHGDFVTAGSTRFRVAVEGAPADGEAQTSRPATAVEPRRDTLRSIFRAAGWTFRHLPDRWETVPDRGLRRAAEPGKFTPELVVTAGSLPEDVSLQRHTESLVGELVGGLAGAKADDPSVAAVAGADEAWQTTVRYPQCGDFALAQRLCFARSGGRLGAVALTGSESELNELSNTFDDVLAGLSFDNAAEDAAEGGADQRPRCSEPETCHV